MDAAKLLGVSVAPHPNCRGQPQGPCVGRRLARDIAGTTVGGGRAGVDGDPALPMIAPQLGLPSPDCRRRLPDLAC